jgi:hypothetical protein
MKMKARDLCKTPSSAQFRCQAQILILEILNVFLWLKLSPSLNLNKIKHFSKASALAVFTGLLFWGVLSAGAQEPPDNKNQINEAIKVNQKVYFAPNIRLKKLYIAQNLHLTEAEGKAFWPVYESYQKDLQKLADRIDRMLRLYVREYSKMTDNAAADMLNESLAVEAAHLEIKRQYLPMFRKVLPPIKLTRYYQLESKFSAQINFELEAKVPLINLK